MPNASLTVREAPSGAAEFKMKNFLVMLSAIAMIASGSAVHAQQPEPSPKVLVTPKVLIDPSRLLLEILYDRKIPPGYSSVNGPNETSKWIWVTRYVRIPGKPQPPGKPIGAVKLESQFNGETADVRVTLLRGGTGGFDQEDLVGVYRLGIGEQKVISDLEQFNIEPFHITLLNAVPPLPPSPSFENATKSLEVVSVRTENIPRPAYKITLRNLSTKSVIGVRVQLTTDGRPGESVVFQGDEGRALIEPGGTVEKDIHVIRGAPAPSDYGPGTPSVVIIGVRAAIFNDFSFEGEFRAACLTEWRLMSERLWLQRVLPLIDEELGKSNSDHIEAVKQFKQKFSALSYDLEASELNRASAVGPQCPKPGQSAQAGTGYWKLKFLRELDQIITSGFVPPLTFKSWLKEKRSRYAAWLERMQ